MLDLTTCALVKLSHFLRTFNIHIKKYIVRLKSNLYKGLCQLLDGLNV